MNKQENIPALRFPEFSGNWVVKKLGEIFKITAGGDIDVKNVSYFQNDIFKYPIYANAEKDKGFYGYSDIYKIDENVITVAGRGVNIGIAHARNHKFYPIVRLLVLKPYSEANIYFFEYQINRLETLKESTGVPQLTAPQISGYKVFFPPLPEQQKIATFLSSVDEKLQGLKKKKSLLEAYKKGMMQRLFSQTLRFKDENGEDFPEWEEKTLGEVGTIITGSTPPTDKTQYYGGEYLFVSPVDISSNRFIKSTKTTLTIEGLSHSRKIRRGSSLFVCIGSTIGKVGQASTDCTSNQQINAVVPDVISNSDDFIYSLLEYHSSKIKTLAATQAVPIINKTTFSDYYVFIPTLPEQTKIANFLSAIDEKIAKVSQEIEQATVWKKGLLQQMFV